MWGLVAKPDSPHYQAAVSSLFSLPPRPSHGFIYDLEAIMPEHAPLKDNVQERLASIFRLHGAVDMEPPLLIPIMEPDDKSHQATFIDRHGDVVALPDNILVPFTRLAARGNFKRIKRYHITNIYRLKYILNLFCMLCCVLTNYLQAPLLATPRCKKPPCLILSHQICYPAPSQPGLNLLPSLMTA
jgi:hypothetical protein